jgi:hypothetical protein
LQISKKNATIPPMTRFVKFLVAALGLLLPWHGAITVFLPEEFRWWKELVLGMLAIAIVMLEFSKKKRAPLAPTEKWALGFLAWCGILTIFNSDFETAAVAARYLGFGFFAFLVLSRAKNVENNLLEIFTKFFVPAAAASVIFGVWVKFFGGADFVQIFYSNAISSWVPGQTIPLWHETENFVRMQGASSGPTEFSHLLLAATALIFTEKNRSNFLFKILFCTLFLFGIFQSFSRAAILGSIILFAVFAFQNFKISRKKTLAVIFSTIAIFSGFLFLNKNLVQNFVGRSGTIAHFSRPIEATKMGIDAPLLGNLGKLGPAARAKNLTEKNDDRAPIAENVLADWFAQLGALGFLLGIGFLFSLGKTVKPRFLGFLIAAFLMMNLATIFEMTPIGITFFALFAFFQKSEKIHTK